MKKEEKQHQLLSKTSGYIIFSIALSSILLTFSFTQKLPLSANDSSRFATIESLAFYGTYVIDESVFNPLTIDKVKINGHFVSTKPPLLPTLGAGVAFIYRLISGKTFKNYANKYIYLINIIFGVIPQVFLLFYFYRFLRLWTSRLDVMILVFISISFGYLGLGYATTINNHTASAATAFIAFYYAYLLRNGYSKSYWLWLVSGFLSGLTIALEIPGAIFILGYFIYLASYDRKKTLTLFLPALCLPIIIHFILNYMATGSFVPIYLRGELYNYPGSYWTRPEVINRLQENRVIYLFKLLFAHHGYLSMTPLLFFSIAGLFITLKKRLLHMQEALLIGGAVFVLIIFYTIYTPGKYGGLCVGFRWLIITVPFQFVFIAVWLETNKSRALMILFFFFLFISQFNAFNALKNPWQSSIWEKFLIRNLTLLNISVKPVSKNSNILLYRNRTD